ncbi:MAG: thioredoxin TrxC [Pseudomonadota bacterium]
MTTTTLTCAKCNTTNRIPNDRIGDKPKCGKCKEQILQGRPIELTTANVSVVLNGNSVPVLVDCWAPWCGPCKSFAPIFEQAAQQLEPRIRLAKLNTEMEQQLGGEWRIQSIPTLILFRDAVEVNRMSGAMPLNQLKKWLLEQGV